MKKRKKNRKKKFYVVDIFCGIGGLTHGFIKEKFKVVAGIDIDSSCKYAFETNNKSKFIEKKIEDLTGSELKRLYPKNGKRILIGCAPCTPFSAYTYKVEYANKWKLLNKFGRLVKDVKPHIISMENVPQLKSHKVYRRFLSVLKKNKYFISENVVKCERYGIPQTRRRLVLLASKLGDINLIGETHDNETYKTVKDAIGKLEPIKSGGRGKEDKIHRSRKLSDINLKRIKATREGGSWLEWENELRLKCHKKRTGKSYKNIYGRMKWDKPAPTITTQSCGIGNGRFGHPEQHRAISLREAALLQTFPKYYKFLEPREQLIIYKTNSHIGNAVPVRLGRIIARSIKKHIREVSYV